MVAVAENGVIGSNNKLPWRLPEDLRYFKRTTMGKPVIMGRKTWDSIGRPLPGRTNIVVSRQPDLQLEGALLAGDLEAALTLAESVAFIDGVEEVVVIGGAELYRLALPQADRLYLTEVHAVVTGDAYFPDWRRETWREAMRERYMKDESNPYDYSFVVYERNSGSTG